MTTGDAAIDPSASDGPIREGSPFAAAPRTWWDDVEDRIERFGERLNPILVKESRQALKSLQFVITFFLLLICGWGWSLLYLFIQYSIVGEGIFYAPHGAPMLVGFCCLLAFPLIVIVPFTAFRSLSAEREDGTFELVSITTLQPWQIVSGKLGSAILQMMLYVSALAPGMVFTYMLRGVDIVFILLLCGYLCLASMVLSIYGLLLSTVTSSRVWQMVIGVIFILKLTTLYLMVASSSFSILGIGALPYDQMEFWAAQQSIVSITLAYAVLVFLAAAARLTFESDNRSTKLRIAMLGINALCIGWGVWLWLITEEEESLYVVMTWAGHQWLFWGGLMVGESADLSPRVRRHLPKSYLARMFFTWFNPGPGTGYLFTVVNVLALTLLIFAAAAVSNMYSFGGRLDEEQVLFALFIFLYVTFYVGITRLVMLLLSRFVFPNIFLSVLILMLLVLAGAAVPAAISVSLSALSNQPPDYSPLQSLNWAWTLVEIADNGLGGGFLGIPVEAVLAALAAGVVLILNLMLSANEVDPHHAATPKRVLEEERELHPERFATTTTPSSPWDNDEPGGEEILESDEPPPAD